MKIEFKIVFETFDKNVLNSLDELLKKIEPTLEKLNIKNFMPTVTIMDEIQK